jgi:hypothetical protein
MVLTKGATFVPHNQPRSNLSPVSRGTVPIRLVRERRDCSWITGYPETIVPDSGAGQPDASQSGPEVGRLEVVSLGCWRFCFVARHSGFNVCQANVCTVAPLATAQRRYPAIRLLRRGLWG